MTAPSGMPSNTNSCFTNVILNAGNCARPVRFRQSREKNKKIVVSPEIPTVKGWTIERDVPQAKERSLVDLLD